MANEPTTYTIWSNGGKFEWILRNSEEITSRSGMIFNTRKAAKADMMKNMEEQESK